MEVWSSGDALQARRRGDVEVLLEFLAVVPHRSLGKTLQAPSGLACGPGCQVSGSSNDAITKESTDPHRAKGCEHHGGNGSRRHVSPIYFFHRYTAYCLTAFTCATSTSV